MWSVYDFKPDSGIDVAYILLAEVHPGEDAITIVKVDVPSEWDLPPALGGGRRKAEPQSEADIAIRDAVRALMLEFDRDNRLVAIEVWGASEYLPKSFLDMAAAETRPKPIAAK
ncbi:MAG TPA: hypothetical protein VFB09_01075 [Actinomycetota bacterium]|nr:hypothetical protein [Actinomycetota bacterium]